jgi:Mn-dependent DtxR family transcriptional regulator
MLLLYEWWCTDGQPVVLSNILARDVSVSPRSKSRAIAELQRLDLIAVERYQRKSPLVILKHHHKIRD